MENFLDIPGKMTKTSLELPMRLEYDEWRVVGLRLAQVRRWTQFAIGDWLNYGEHHYGETYAQAAGETNLSPDTLKNYKYVSSRIEKSLRNDFLTWSHHKEVAALEPKEQEKWLTRAQKKNLDVGELKVALEETGMRKKPKSRQTHDLEKGAAEYAGRKLAEAAPRNNIGETCECCGLQATPAYKVCDDCFGWAKEFRGKERRSENMDDVEQAMADAVRCERCNAKIWPAAAYEKHLAQHEERDRLVNKNNVRACITCGALFSGLRAKCKHCRAPSNKKGVTGKKKRSMGTVEKKDGIKETWGTR